MEFDNFISLNDIVYKSNTGADAIKKAPIVEENTGIKCLRIQDVSNRKDFNDWGNCKIDKKYYSNFQLKKDDIIISRTGNSIGTNIIILEDLESVYNNGLIRIKIKNNFDSKFVYYNLQSKKFRDFINSIAYGTSAQPNMKINDFLSFKIKYFELPEQKKIASILSAFDEKIQLNNQINKNLEQMAQVFFKSWFVDFEPFLDCEFEETELGMIPKNWTIAKLGDIVEQIKNSAKKDLDTENKPYVPIDQIDSKKLALTNFKPWEEAQSSLIKFEKNDILFGAMRAYFHKVCISPFYGITRTTCFVLRPKNNFDLSFSLMKIFEEKTIDFANSHSTGSTIPYAVWDNGLCDMPIILPPESIRKEFHNKVFSIIEKIRDSIFEIEILKQQRDTLLPKLMSGEIRV
jgi:type I restriction enzyme S subunit